MLVVFPLLVLFLLLVGVAACNPTNLLTDCYDALCCQCLFPVPPLIQRNFNTGQHGARRAFMAEPLTAPPSGSSAHRRMAPRAEVGHTHGVRGTTRSSARGHDYRRHASSWISSSIRTQASLPKLHAECILLNLYT
mmetsp:Transcript_24927/g.62592  ORF Transcript_24927/g.62592 Transcript_24927/m.62592 type:complete len:136 (-) Transcript_24927:3705-4112(-)